MFVRGILTIKLIIDLIATCAIFVFLFIYSIVFTRPEYRLPISSRTQFFSQTDMVVSLIVGFISCFWLTLRYAAWISNNTNIVKYPSRNVLIAIPLLLLVVYILSITNNYIYNAFFP